MISIMCEHDARWQVWAPRRAEVEEPSMKPVAIAVLAAAAALAAPAAAQHHDHIHPQTDSRVSPHAGAQDRAIRSLSEDDIVQLRQGAGWGLALAAELNGVPGPAHLLALKDEIPLRDDQIAAIRTIFERMREAAIAEGERLIGLEAELEAGFRDRTITETTLKRLLSRIAESRATLRHIHLSAHLETPRLLSAEQIARYNALRGYGGG
jgi:hypothetical protein